MTQRISKAKKNITTYFSTEYAFYMLHEEYELVCKKICIDLCNFIKLPWFIAGIHIEAIISVGFFMAF